MEIIKFPNPILFTKCKDVTVFDEVLSLELKTMYDTMIKEYGIGLAANQVGLIKRMFVMNFENQPLFLVNPKILWKSRENASIKEGCLSAPGEFIAILDRSSIVKIEFQDENGNKKTKLLNDVYAICAQHEIDHLDGKAFLESKTIPKKIRKKLAQKWNIR
jgi:peptide deformylase